MRETVGINLISLRVTDLDRTRAFYKKLEVELGESGGAAVAG